MDMHEDGMGTAVFGGSGVEFYSGRTGTWDETRALLCSHRDIIALVCCSQQ